MYWHSLLILLFASIKVLAQTTGFDIITAPTQDQNVAAGSTLDIVWEPSTKYSGTVTINLLEGASPSTLSLGDVVASGISNTAGKYSWTIPSNIASFNVYGFKLTLDSDATVFQYSFPFHITKGQASSVSASTPAPAPTPSPKSTETLSLSQGQVSTPTSQPTSNTNPTLQTIPSSMNTPNTQISSPTSSGSTISKSTSSMNNSPTTASEPSSVIPSPTTISPKSGQNTSASTVASIPTSGPETSPSTQPQGLTKSAKIGIGIGAALGGALLIGVVVCAFLFGMRVARGKETNKIGGGDGELGIRELGGEEKMRAELVGDENLKRELDGRGGVGQMERVELPGRRADKYEMP